MRQRGISRIKGVCPRYYGRHRKGQADRVIRAWRAQIRHNGKVIVLGEYKKPEVARRAYDRAALLLKGEFAWINGAGIVSDTGSETLPWLAGGNGN